MGVMKKASMAWRRLMGAAAMGVAMLLVSVAASAHVPVGHQDVAGKHVVAVDQAPVDCMHAGLLPTSGYRLHCHVSSLPPLADGVKLLHDRDPAAAYETAAPVFAARDFRAEFQPALLVPIAAPPPYILFGNFRS